MAQTTVRSRRFAWPLVILTGILASSVSARADSLSARPAKDVLEAAEPIILEVSLRLEQAYRPNVEDPPAAAKKAGGLTHRIAAELWDGEQRVASAFIGGVRFVPLEDAEHDLHATVMGWFGIEEPGGGRSRFTFWTVPGRFRVVVKGVESGLEAEGFTIEITRPAEPTAEQLLVSGALDALAVLLLQHKHGELAVPTLEHLADEFPDTVQGKYARGALAIRRAAKLRTALLTAGASTSRDNLAKELEDAAATFENGHPLRVRALLELAHALLGTNERDRAVETARQVLAEAQDGGLCEAAQQFLNEMVRPSESQSPAEGP